MKLDIESRQQGSCRGITSNNGDDIDQHFGTKNSVSRCKCIRCQFTITDKLPSQLNSDSIRFIQLVGWFAEFDQIDDVLRNTNL